MPEPMVFNAATGQYVHGAAIADPTGGTTVDAEARAATSAILGALRTAAVIDGATVAPPVGHVWNAGRVVLGVAIPNPTGGATVDVEGRAAIDAMLTVLRGKGIIAGSGTMPTFIVDEDTNTITSAAIADPIGGAADVELRTAVNGALAAMRSANLIAQD